MPTKLNVYREASQLLGNDRLADLTEDTEIRHAFDDAWLRVVVYVLRQAYWKFSLKTVELTDVSAIAPLPGYSYAFDLPCDWLRTHALFRLGMTYGLECPVDVKHQLEQINLNQVPTYIRYISDDYTDSDTWPEHFAFAVATRLAFETAERLTGNPDRSEKMAVKWQEAMQLAVAPDAVPENAWLRHQLSGSFLDGYLWLLDEAMWKFAIKTVALVGNDVLTSPGYAWAVAKPDDLGRIIHYYTNQGTEWLEIDFRDENGRLHSQYKDTVLRYLSTVGEDSTTWTDGFRRALLSYLEFEEVKRNPAASGAATNAKGLTWSEAFKNAKLKNDMSERPRFNDVGVLTRARLGYGGGRRADGYGRFW